MKRIFVLLLSLSLFVACNPAPSAPAAPIEVTRIITATPGPTQTPHIIVVTATPIPTPDFGMWTADQVVEAFRTAGLEVEGPTEMTKEDYGIAPMAAKKGIHFFVPSLCADCGGRILEFDNLDGLTITQTYYESLGVQSAAFFSWVFVKDNILVQINGELPEEQARNYERVLNGLSK